MVDVPLSCSDSEESQVLDSIAFLAARRRAASGEVIVSSTQLFQPKL
jgi:hypothetical protein